MSEEVQETLSEYDSIVAELERSKAAGDAPKLPDGIVLDAEFTTGFYRKRPCLEEFVAARYPAEAYDSWFTSATEDKDGNPRVPWGPGWSNPSWSPEFKDRGDLPTTLVVRSQVRRQATRMQRARSATRHRFKQYIGGDPSLRLVRNRQITLPTERVLTLIDELITRQRDGMISVHMIDGRPVDLLELKAGVLSVGRVPLPAPQPNPPLDSIANDDPAGNPYPQYIEGSYPGDPEADKVLNRMLEDKKGEHLDGIDDLLDALSDAAKGIAESAKGVDEGVELSGTAKDEENAADGVETIPPEAASSEEQTPGEDPISDTDDVDSAADEGVTEEAEAPAVADESTEVAATPSSAPATQSKKNKKGNKR